MDGYVYKYTREHTATLLVVCWFGRSLIRLFLFILFVAFAFLTLILLDACYCARTDLSVCVHIISTQV